MPNSALEWPGSAALPPVARQWPALGPTLHAQLQMCSAQVSERLNAHCLFAFVQRTRKLCTFRLRTLVRADHRLQLAQSGGEGGFRREPAESPPK